jgi:hypothetical protein
MIVVHLDDILDGNRLAHSALCPQKQVLKHIPEALDSLCSRKLDEPLNS